MTVVLFDIGNVIIDIDFRPVVALNPDITRDTWRQVGRSELYDRYEKGELTTDQFRTELQDVLGLTFSESAFLSLWNALFVGPVAGMESLLTNLRPKCKLCALSNTNQAHYDFIVKEFKSCLGHFEKIFTSFDLKLRKPDPAIYHKVCRQLGVSPEDVIFIDDLEDNVEAARSVGMRAARCRSSSTGVLEILTGNGVDVGPLP